MYMRSDFGAATATAAGLACVALLLLRSQRRRPRRDDSVASNALDLIGNTPLLELPSLSAATGCRVLAKAEVRLRSRPTSQRPPVPPHHADTARPWPRSSSIRAAAPRTGWRPRLSPRPRRLAHCARAGRSSRRRPGAPASPSPWCAPPRATAATSSPQTTCRLRSASSSPRSARRSSWSGLPRSRTRRTRSTWRGRVPPPSATAPSLPTSLRTWQTRARTRRGRRLRSGRRGAASATHG